MANLNNRVLEEILKATTAAVAPEKLAEKVDVTVRENPALRIYVIDPNGRYIPEQIAVLSRFVEESYLRNKSTYDLATAIDIADATISGVELGGAIATGGASDIASAFSVELAESVPKLAYGTYAGIRFKNWKLGAILIGAETLSIILPVIGDLIDLAPIYRWQVGKAIRKEAATNYIANIISPTG